MRSLVLILVSFVFLAACSSTSTNSTISPLQAVGCDVETAVVSAEASAIAGLLTCTNQSTIQTALLTALGNANLCGNAQVSQATTAQMSQAKAQKTAAKPMGIVGTIACPIVINVAIGYATQAIPTTWGCSASASAASLTAALTTACEAAVPL